MFQNYIKIILSALFILCLFNMPYGYFQLVRFTALVGFSLLSYKSFSKNEIIPAILYLSLALLFQPLIKIALGRTIWNIIDVAICIALLISIYYTKMNYKGKNN